MEQPPEGSAAAERITDTVGSEPVRPRAPLENVYAAACRAGEGGSVTLYTAALEQTTRGGVVTDSRTLTAEELSALLAAGGMRSHHSEQHQSSCVYRAEKDGSVVTVWYESAADVMEKLKLCRLLGVSAVYVIK